MKLQLIILGLLFVVVSVTLLQVNKTFDCSTIKEDIWQPVEHNNMTYAQGVGLCKQTTDSGYTMSSLLLYGGIGVIILGFILGRKHKQQNPNEVKHE